MAINCVSQQGGSIINLWLCALVAIRHVAPAVIVRRCAVSNSRCASSRSFPEVLSVWFVVSDQREVNDEPF